MMKQVDVFLQQADTKKTAAPPEFHAHYKIVSEAAAELDRYNTNQEAQKDRYWKLKLLCASMAPRGMGLGAGDLVQEASWPFIVMVDEASQKKTQQPQESTASPPIQPSPVTSESWMPSGARPGRRLRRGGGDRTAAGDAISADGPVQGVTMTDESPRGPRPLLIGWKAPRLPRLGHPAGEGQGGYRCAHLRPGRGQLRSVSRRCRRPVHSAAIGPAPQTRPASRTRWRTRRYCGWWSCATPAGCRSSRPLIETDIVLGPVRSRILLTVTNRSGMLFRVILGRQGAGRGLFGRCE